MSGDEWVTPVCPGCESPPLFGRLVEPAFCPKEQCHVVSWNPRQTLAELAAGDLNYMDLSGLTGEAPDDRGGRVPRERPPGE